MGSSYGDDAQMDTNFPIVTLTPAGASSPVYFARVTSVGDRTPAPGMAGSVQFAVPAAVPATNYDIRAIANGISSAPYRLLAAPTFDFPNTMWGWANGYTVTPIGQSGSFTFDTAPRWPGAPPHLSAQLTQVPAGFTGSVAPTSFVAGQPMTIAYAVGDTCDAGYFVVDVTSDAGDSATAVLIVQPDCD
jgi:hypothetical protein